MGEEREKAVHELHGERENFEKQLLTLVDQQEKILQEREGTIKILYNKGLEARKPGPWVIHFFMFNSTEHEISTAHKSLNTDKYLHF